jgi:phosphopantetheine binding protein
LRDGSPDSEGLGAPLQYGRLGRPSVAQARLVIFPKLTAQQEAELAALFIDAADDFFHLGGNSLLATQVIARVRRRFRIEIIRALFDNPTLAGFSRAVEAAPRVEDEALREIRPQARSRTELGELRDQLVKLAPEELDALLRSIRPDTSAPILERDGIGLG